MKRPTCWCAAGIVTLILVSILLFLSLRFVATAELPSPQRGFDLRREGIERGKVETIEYDSKAAGCMRSVHVYSPPGFSKDQKYPVLYLLHGSLSDENSWVKNGAADTILDNLYADKNTVPMIVVMPNGNLVGADGKSGDATAEFNAFAADLQDSIIPCVETNFPVKADRRHRAIAGVSAGAHETISFWLTHPDDFAYVGIFIGGLENCAQFEKSHKDALENVGAKTKPKLLWIANGKNDLTYSRCQDTLRLFDKYQISYVYMEGKGVHDWETARNDLFVFAQLLFRETDW